MSMMKIMKLYIILLLFPIMLFAHGSGASLEKEVGNYFIDIGYEPAEIVAGDSLRFDFGIFTGSDKSEVLFSDIWVNISKENKTVFATGVHRQDLGTTGLTMVFPEGGEYVLDVRFQNKGESIAQTTFSIDVLESENDSGTAKSIYSSYFGLIASFVFGIGVAYFGLRRKE
jgi:hypothetical protein